MIEEVIGPAVSNQLAEVAMKYWSQESKNPAVVNKILEILANCSGVRVSVLNEFVARNRKLCNFIKEMIKDYQIFKKGYFLLHQQSLK